MIQEVGGHGASLKDQVSECVENDPVAQVAVVIRMN